MSYSNFETVKQFEVSDICPKTNEEGLLTESWLVNRKNREQWGWWELAKATVLLLVIIIIFLSTLGVKHEVFFLSSRGVCVGVLIASLAAHSVFGLMKILRN